MIDILYSNGYVIYRLIEVKNKINGILKFLTFDITCLELKETPHLQLI